MKSLKFWLTAMAIAAPAVMATAQSKVYMTRDISPEALVKIYQALGRPADGHRVAVKISTGEAGNPNYLKPTLIGPLVDTVRGTIVECNTAY
ncbi:MAG: ferredoxin, partial [Muribaculaceae bacterium]|nr:ferredoxin [Muribaculaceae bacterium]